MKEYFVKNIDKLKEIENEFDYNLKYIGLSKKYRNWVEYRDIIDNINIYVRVEGE